MACELPYQHGLPLSRWSLPEIRREVIEHGLVASIGETTLWRWLTEDAIRPWCLSVLQRETLTPNDFRSLSELRQRLLSLHNHYGQVARPFQWRFTRRDPRRLMLKLSTARSGLAQAA